MNAITHPGLYGNHPEYDRMDWRDEARNGDTQLGYWTWVEHKILSDNAAFSSLDFPKDHVFVALDPLIA